MIATTNFQGALLHTGQHHVSFERFYHQYTQRKPSFYQIVDVKVSDLCIVFNAYFKSEIVDFAVLDTVITAHNRKAYTMCYVLKNHIFVVLEEATDTVKIMYHNVKNDTLRHIVDYCHHFKN
jgi:hypothetical protein